VVGNVAIVCERFPVSCLMRDATARVLRDVQCVVFSVACALCVLLPVLSIICVCALCHLCVLRVVWDTNCVVSNMHCGYVVRFALCVLGGSVCCTTYVCFVWYV